MLLLGVLHIHDNEIVHRDLKPANVLIDRNNKLYIIDFGVAITPDVEHDYLGKKTFSGTPLFMAPEIFKSDGQLSSYGKNVDIYACGVILNLLLSGEYSLGRERATSIEELKEIVCNRSVTFESEAFTNVPDSAKDLISQML